MKVISSPSVFQKWCKQQNRLGFVPTMGALHQGHLALVRRAIRENRRTAVSIFVNPTQFGPKEDFSAYPRPVAKDLALLKALKTDVVFTPKVHAMYPEGFGCKVNISGSVSTVLEGAKRPGHFDGVATVVSKLFNLSGKCSAYFGLKDYQQLLIVRKLAADLNFDIKIVACPIVREKDGLALSSRNAYLTASQRQEASGLRKALLQVKRALLQGASFSSARSVGLRELKNCKGFRLDYLEVVDSKNLGVPKKGKSSIILAAAFLGKTRLIDNLAS